MIKGEDFRKLRKIAGFSSQEKLGKAIGVSRSAVYDWEHDKYLPESKNAIKLSKIFNVSVAYLIGESDDSSQYIDISDINKEQLNDVYNSFKIMSENFNNKTDSNNTNKAKTNNISIITNQFVFVPVVELKACAGNGNGYADICWNNIGVLPVERAKIIGHTWQSEDMKIIRINGESMSPKFHDGDQLLFVKGEEYNASDIVIAVFDDKIYVRGFFPEKDQIRLKPLDHKIPDIVVPLGDERLKLEGKVIARVPRLEMDGGFYS